MNKVQIIEEIKRTAAENGGVPLGERRFEAETGISRGSWRGKHWRNWGEAVRAADLPPNQPKGAHERTALILGLVTLARKNGRFPTYADLRMAKHADPTFPTHHSFPKHLGEGRTPKADPLAKRYPRIPRARRLSQAVGYVTSCRPD
jgi:hypothetical protein